MAVGVNNTRDQSFSLAINLLCFGIVFRELRVAGG